MWRETSDVLRRNQVISEQAPLVKRAVAEHFTQNKVDWHSDFWKRNRVAYGKQWAIVEAEVLRCRAVRDAENAVNDRLALAQKVVPAADKSLEPRAEQKNRTVRSQPSTRKRDDQPLDI